MRLASRPACGPGGVGRHRRWRRRCSTPLVGRLRRSSAGRVASAPRRLLRQPASSPRAARSAAVRYALPRSGHEHVAVARSSTTDVLTGIASRQLRGNGPNRLAHSPRSPRVAAVPAVDRKRSAACRGRAPGPRRSASRRSARSSAIRPGGPGQHRAVAAGCRSMHAMR